MQELQKVLKRSPIPEDVVAELVDKSDWSCCLCWDVNINVPIIIHHIVEHAKSADDSYSNLVVLCPNHHATAHSKWEISRSPASPEYIRIRKDQLEKAVFEYRAGRRAAPGREGTLASPHSHSDCDVLKLIASYLDRPAMRQPFHVEGNMMEFLKALSDIIQALGTGILKTRSDNDIGRTKAVRELDNPRWREAMLLTRGRVEDIRTRVEMAVRNEEMILRPDGFYAFENRELPAEIDSMRSVVIALVNSVLREAHIPPIETIRRWPPM